MCKQNVDGTEADWLVYCYSNPAAQTYEVWAEQVCDDPAHWYGGGWQVLASGLNETDAKRIAAEEHGNAPAWAA